VDNIKTSCSYIKHRIGRVCVDGRCSTLIAQPTAWCRISVS